MAEKYEIRNMLFLEKDRQKDIKVGNENWKIRALFEKDRLEISRRTAMARNGLAENSYGMSDRYRFTRIATIDVSLVEYPSWWENAEDCPDSDLLENLFSEIEKFSDDFQKKLKKNQFAKRGTET